MSGDSNDVRRKEEPMKEYPMTHKPRGRALIFNHYRYKSDSKERVGTERDKEKLRNIFTELHFLTEVCDDFTREQIRHKLFKVSQENHAKYDCLAVVVMTHGNEIEIEEKGIEGKDRLPVLRATDKRYYDSELWEPFSSKNCPTLKGKPKLFFIQACRGSKMEEATYVDPLKTQKESTNKIYVDYSSETEADLLVARSCSSGFVSFRPSEGSYFIRFLCEELEDDLKKENDKKDDVGEILRKVQQRLSREEIEYANKTDNKQMPWVESNLRKLLYFRNLD